MDLEQLSQWIAKEAREIQNEMQNLCLSTDTHSSPKSTKAVESALSRIEQRLVEVHGHTGELVERVPRNLTHLLLGIKTAVLERIDSLKIGSPRSAKSGGSNEAVRSRSNWLKEALDKLSPQEQRLFQMCFQTGLITYKELAKHLDIAPTSAKNIVNRLYLITDKRKLFRKEHTHGVARVGVAESVEKQILSGRKGSNRDQGPRTSEPVGSLKQRL